MSPCSCLGLRSAVGLNGLSRGAMKQATLQVQAVLRTVRSVVEFRKNLLHGKACASWPKIL